MDKRVIIALGIVLMAGSVSVSMARPAEDVPPLYLVREAEAVSRAIKVFRQGAGGEGAMFAEADVVAYPLRSIAA